MFSTNDNSYDDFKTSINKFLSKLNIPFEDLLIVENETESESGTNFHYYNVVYSDENGNHLRLFVQVPINQNWSEIETIYSLDLGFSDTPAHFYFHSSDASSSLNRWLSNCLKNISEYKRTPFDYYFHNSPYLNYGVEGASDPTAYLFRTTLFGILKTDDYKQVWVARIQHIREGDLYRSYSYAILPPESVHWLIFPDAVGLDSGGAYSGYNKIEKSLKEASKIGEIKIVDIDASIEEFKTKFKNIYTTDIKPCYKETLYEKLTRMNKDGVELTEFFKVAQRIDNEIDNREYMLVLREMRALIQGLGKHICKTKNIPLENNQNINQLSGTLLKNEVIDPHIKVWFEAFHSIANEAAHGVDSSKLFDMDYDIETDLFDTTIKLGQHLIIQLFSKV